MTKVLIALPGNSFSGKFMMNLVDIVIHLRTKDYKVYLMNEYSSFVAFSRMRTLGLDVLKGATQKPFDGKLDYDVWLTLDSDIICTPDQVIELIEDTKTYPVVSGLYRMADLKSLCAVEKWDEEFFKQYGTFQFLSSETIFEEKYMPVAYTGMGFFACRREVLEKLKYPYFHHQLIEIAGENGRLLRDMCSEDVAFCKNLNDAGIQVTVNTSLRVGHEKTLVI